MRSMLFAFRAMSCCLAIGLLGSAAPAANLIPNPSFDTALGIDGWTADPQVSWDPLDADGSASSGSALIALSDQVGVAALFYCVPAQEGQTYDYNAEQLTDAGQADGTSSVHLEFYSGPGCSGNGVGNAPYVYSNVTGAWTSFGGTGIGPAGAQSVLLSLLATQSGAGTRVVRFDNAFLPEPGEGALGLVGLAGLAALRLRRCGARTREAAQR